MARGRLPKAPTRSGSGQERESMEMAQDRATEPSSTTPLEQRRPTARASSDVRSRIVLLNLYHGGHHPQHLECLLIDWARRKPRDELHVVVSRKHAEQHPHLPALVDETPNATLHLVRTPVGFGDGPENVLDRERLHRRVAAHYAGLVRADHLVFMYFDHVQLSLAFDLRFGWPLAVSGIYFRSSVHYRALGVRTRGWRERLAPLGKEILLRAALRNPHLRTLFCLDPFAAAHIARWGGHTESVFLPEPLWVPNPLPDVPTLANDVEPGRRRLVFFGSLDDRKGIRPVLDALAAMPESRQRRLALIFAGRVRGSQRDALLAHMAAFKESSHVQVLVDDRFMPEAEVQPLLAACDLVLLTYQRDHVGSSGGLVRAAAAGVPVLSTDHGLVGLQVRKRRLGLALDATSSDEIRAALLAWLEHRSAIPFDSRSAERFAAANTAEAFAKTIFSRVLPT